MKVVFLDIDGVLNTENYIDSIVLTNTYCNTNFPIKDDYGKVFDPSAVRYLVALCKKHNLKVVISSDWRYSGLDRLKMMFKSRNINVDIIDTTICNANYKTYKTQFMELQKLTKIRFSQRVERGYEIQAWLNTHPDVENYVIFDDNNDMLESQEDHFVCCNDLYGIDYLAYFKADQILSNPELKREIH